MGRMMFWESFWLGTDRGQRKETAATCLLVASPAGREPAVAALLVEL